MGLAGFSSRLRTAVHAAPVSAEGCIAHLENVLSITCGWKHGGERRTDRGHDNQQLFLASASTPPGGAAAKGVRSVWRVPMVLGVLVGTDDPIAIAAKQEGQAAETAPVLVDLSRIGPDTLTLGGKPKCRRRMDFAGTGYGSGCGRERSGRPIISRRPGPIDGVDRATLAVASRRAACS